MKAFQVKWRWFLLVCVATNVLSAEPAADSKYRFQDYLECTYGAREIALQNMNFQMDGGYFAVQAYGKIFFLSSTAAFVLPLDRVRERLEYQLDALGRPTARDMFIKPDIEELSHPLRLAIYEKQPSGHYSLSFSHAGDRKVQAVSTDSITEGNSLPSLNHLIIDSFRQGASWTLNSSQLSKQEEVLERILPACLRLGSVQIAVAIRQFEKSLKEKKPKDPVCHDLKLQLAEREKDFSDALMNDSQVRSSILRSAEDLGSIETMSNCAASPELNKIFTMRDGVFRQLFSELQKLGVYPSDAKHSSGHCSFNKEGKGRFYIERGSNSYTYNLSSFGHNLDSVDVREPWRTKTLYTLPSPDKNALKIAETKLSEARAEYDKLCGAP